MKASLLILSLPIALIFGPIIRGWVLTKLWVWFIVAPFNAAPLGVAQCIGLSLIVGFLTKESAHCDDKRPAMKRFWAGMAQIFIDPLFLLLFAYVVSLYL